MEGTDAVRVLLIDDDPDCANSTAMLFRHFGAEVRTSTILGWRATKRAFEPDLIMIDLGIPGRIDSAPRCDTPSRLNSKHSIMSIST